MRYWLIFLFGYVYRFPFHNVHIIGVWKGLQNGDTYQALDIQCIRHCVPDPMRLYLDWEWWWWWCWWVGGWFVVGGGGGVVFVVGGGVGCLCLFSNSEKQRDAASIRTHDNSQINVVDKHIALCNSISKPDNSVGVKNLLVLCLFVYFLQVENGAS